MRPAQVARPRSGRRPVRFARLRLERLEDRAVPAAVNWTLGANGDFADPTAWTVAGTSPPEHRVPGPTDDATIPAAVSVTSSADEAVNSLLATNFSILGGTFTINAQAQASSLTGLTLSSGAALSVAAGNQTVFITGSTMAGALSVGSGDTLAFVGGTNTLATGATVSGIGQVFVTGGSLLVNAPVSVANLNLSSGTVGGTGVLTLTGASIWSSGTMSDVGGTTVAAGATLALASGTQTLTQRSLDVFGTVNDTGGGLTFNSAAALTVHPGGTFNLSADVNLSGASGTVTNQGLFVKTSPGGVSTSTISAALNNAGTLRVDSGTLTLTAGGTSTGAFAVAPAGMLNIPSGTYVLGSGAAVSGAGQVSVTGGTLLVNSPVTLANLVESAGTLLVNAPVTFDSFTLSGGTLGGAGALTLTGASTWSGGTMRDGGMTTVAAGATLALTGTATKTLTQRSLAVVGTVNHTGGALNFSSAAAVTIPLGGTYNLLADVGFGGTGSVTNQGLFVKTGTTGSSTLATAFNSSGTLRVDSGTLFLTGGGTGTGTFAVASGAGLRFAGTTYTLNTGTSVSGTGQVNVIASLVLNVPLALPNFALDGALGGTGTLTLTGTANWTNGTMSGTGTTVVASGATLNLPSGVTTLSQRTLDVAGTVNHTGSTSLLTDAATILIRPGGTYNLSAAGIAQSGAGGTVINQGLFSKTGGTGSFSSITSAFDNTGTLNIPGGILTMTGGYTQSAGTTLVASGATLQTDLQLDGGTLTGGGTVAGNVTGPITISPGTGPGQLTINGNLALLPGGALAAELNGPSAGTQYDQLRVTGSVLLGGALNFSLGYAPAIGDTFTILDNAGSSAIQGSFAGLPQGATLSANGTTFQISYTGGDGNDVVLTATAVTGPRVAAVGMNAGAAQRSMVTSVQVTFSTVVTIAPGAFTLTYIGAPASATGGAVGSMVGGFAVSTATVNGVTVATLSGFTGTDTSFGSLIDGRYSLTVTGSAVTANGAPIADFTYADSGSTTGRRLYRLYGDANGDRVVNGADLTLFIQQFGGPSAAFDFNGDGVVNGADLTQFITRYGLGI